MLQLNSSKYKFLRLHPSLVVSTQVVGTISNAHIRRGKNIVLLKIWYTDIVYRHKTDFAGATNTHTYTHTHSHTLNPFMPVSAKNGWLYGYITLIRMIFRKNKLELLIKTESTSLRLRADSRPDCTLQQGVTNLSHALSC